MANGKALRRGKEMAKGPTGFMPARVKSEDSEPACLFFDAHGSLFMAASEEAPKAVAIGPTGFAIEMPEGPAWPEAYALGLIQNGPKHMPDELSEEGRRIAFQRHWKVMF